MSDPLRETPLAGWHRAAGARMVPFAGFSMPVVYTSIVEEHRAVRSGAGIFDVSHMGELRLRGSSALSLAERVFTNHVRETPEGRVRYGLICDHDGGVIDDVTLLRTGPQEVLLCVNAANIEADVAWIRETIERDGFAAEVVDESEGTGLVAVQGPGAEEVVRPLMNRGAEPPGPWRFGDTRLAGIPAILSRTGYTGEDGFEIFVAADRALELWETLLERSPTALRPAGLGARDTLRTEMAFPLYGHELDRSRTPVQARLDRFLAYGTGFVGEAALRRQRNAAPAVRRVGLVLDGRAVARPGYPILGDGPIGTVTSGTFGPTVERSIAIGYVPGESAKPGTRLAVEIRGRRTPCEVVRTPFYRRKG